MKGVGSMSDSIIAIFSIGWLTGVISTAIALLLWGINDE